MLTRSPYWDYIEIDPIRVQIQIEQIDIPTLRAHLEASTKEMARSVEHGRRVFLIIESRDARRPPPEVRKLQAEWLDENRELIAQSCVGMGFVIESRLVRGALTAIFWMSKPPVPYTVHSSRAEALAHAIEVCDELGVSLPREARLPDPSGRIELAFDRAMSRQMAL